MSKLKYTYEVKSKIEQIKKSFNLKDENIIIVDYCLCCKKKFKVYRGEIQALDSINIYVDKITGEKYLYFLCGKCSNRLINPYSKNEFEDLDNKISEEISKFHPEILSK